MVEKTLILLKPDAMENIDIILKIKELINKEKLKIIFEKEVVLDRNDIIALWGYLISDYIIFSIMVKRFSGKKLIVYNITGEDAINKVHNIKRYVRANYAKNSIDNCLHAPRNEYEYNKDSYILNRKSGEPLIDYSMDIYTLERYSKLKLCELTECSKKVEKMLRVNEDLELKYYNSGKYHLYLYDDDIHLPGEVAGLIYEGLKKLSLEECYMICIWVGLSLIHI